MKLARKYRRYSLVVLTVVLVLGCISQYCIYSYSIHRTTDDVLREYRRDIEAYAAQRDSLLPFSSIELKHSYLRVLSRNAERPRVDERIYDSLIYSFYEGEPVVYRVLNFPVTASDRDYVVTLTLPTLEQDELVLAVVISSVGLFLLFAGASLYALRYMKRTMSPFYRLLAQMRNYDIRAEQPEPPGPTGVDEFDELGQGLHGMMQRMHHDYGALKELMENTSHELQTPLAVVRMKLEQLEQSCVGSREQMELLASIREALRRITRFNRSLMLIARISSDQFYLREPIRLDELAVRFFEEREDIVAAQRIAVVWRSRAACRVSLHPVLAEILVSNILSNALKYNYPGGEIALWCGAEGLCVENTYSNRIPEGDLFRRYVRSEGCAEATGLGLPIVREICVRNGLEVAVEIRADRFRLCLSRA